MSDPRAFLAFDLGTATSSVALIARVGHRWRLIGGLSMPAGVELDAIVALVLERATTADPPLARLIGSDVDDAVTSLPRLIARSAQPRRLAVVAASERALAPLSDAARRSGWLVTAASPERVDPLGVTTSLLDPAVDAVLVGAGGATRAHARPAPAQVAPLPAPAAAPPPALTL